MAQQEEENELGEEFQQQTGGQDEFAMPLVNQWNFSQSTGMGQREDTGLTVDKKEDKSNGAGQTRRAAVPEPELTPSNNPLDEDEFFAVVVEMEPDEMVVDAKTADILMASLEDKPHQVAVAIRFGSVVIHVALDTGAWGNFITMEAHRVLKKKNPGCLSNCIKYESSDPHSKCISASNHLIRKHGREDVSGFLVGKFTGELVLVSATVEIVGDCPLSFLWGLQLTQVMESNMRMSRLDASKKILTVNHPKVNNYQLDRYQKGAVESCSTMVEVGEDIEKVIAIATEEVAGVRMGNKEEVVSQAGVDELVAAMSRNVIGDGEEQVVIPVVQYTKAGNNQSIVPQCW